jgi:hypothetical protein
VKAAIIVVVLILVVVVLVPDADAGPKQCVADHLHLINPGKARILYPFDTLADLIRWCLNPGPLPR